MIAGEQVMLRKIALYMAETMFEAVDSDRERLRVFLSWVDEVKTLEDERRYIIDSHSKWDGHSLFDYGLFSREDGAYLGSVGVHTIAWDHDRCELGYWILAGHEGKGLMTDAVRTLEAALFELGFHRIEIRCNSRNERSAQLPKRNGYQLDGVLRQDCIEHGDYRDTLVFSKLSTDARE
jgi:RimJ/RimL family protein N-acetyltransferase